VVYRLGDLVRVAVARVDLERRELDFRLIAHHARRKPTRPAHRKPATAKGKSPRKARR
jgi:transcriptional accessory protein Tex/SPT6